MTPRLSILIVNWNTRDALQRCLSSVENAPHAREAQVIVVDNASTDGSVSMLRSVFPSVELIENDHNAGFGAANNRALGSARGEFVLFLNPDTELSDGALLTVLECLERDPDVAVAGTTLLNADGSQQQSCFTYYSFFSSLRHNRVVDAVWSRYKLPRVKAPGEPTDVDWMLGACLLVRRSVLDTLGGFDPDYFLYGEEVDLQYRTKRLGWRVVHCPSEGVLHHGAKSAQQAPQAAALHNYRGRWLFVTKHYPWWSCAAYLGKTLFALCVWLGYWTLRSTGAGASRERKRYLQLLAWHIGDRGAVPAPSLGGVA